MRGRRLGAGGHCAHPLTRRRRVWQVGYIRPDASIYHCPVYTTTFRGPTYVVLATLHTREPVSKWILAGVAVVMQTD